MTTLAPELMPSILCPLCGTQTQSNAANMCINCLKTQVDITEGISKQVTVFFCKTCGRYQKPPWIVAQLESPEMLAMCLSKVKGLGKAVRLVDASFIWTEPHSRRIKLKLTVQKEVFNAVILQQAFQVEFVVANMQCPDCARSYTEHTWNSCVQVRQKVKHKRTFFFLEQLLLKHGVCDKSMGVKEHPDGLDFFWSSKSDASHLVDFLRSVACVKSKASKRLISQDDNNNTFNFKHTLFVEIAPVCKDDLCIMPPKLCTALGGVSPLVLCYRVSNVLHFIDPLSLKLCEVSTNMYFRDSFPAIMSQSALTEYVVLDITKGESGNAQNKNRMSLNDRLQIAEVQLVKECDVGNPNASVEVSTHLGHLLNVGDSCLCYDLTHANFNSALPKKFKRRGLPEVVVVRKFYRGKKNRARKRRWRLQKLEKVAADKPLRKVEAAKAEQDYESFLRDIEEDPDIRKKVDLYQKKGLIAEKADAGMDEAGDDDDDEDELPAIEGLLSELTVEPSNTAMFAALTVQPSAPDASTAPLDLTSSSPGT